MLHKIDRLISLAISVALHRANFSDRLKRRLEEEHFDLCIVVNKINGVIRITFSDCEQLNGRPEERKFCFNL